MKLEFGNKEHIKIRDAININEVWNNIKDKIHCPFCKAKALHYFEVNMVKKYFGVNFECNGTCPNSVEYSMENGSEDIEVWFDFKGKNIT